MIKVTNLRKVYTGGAGDVIAIDDISLSFDEGEFVAITGRSGSGKSTLLYQLGVLDTPTSGKVEITGVDINKLTNEQKTKFRLKELGYIFQDYAILPSLTTIENVIIPLMMLGMDNDKATKMAKKALEKVGLEDRMNNLPSQLSGGQQQRVAIARAIAHDPKIIFADEPTANLDSETAKMVLKTFIDLNKEGQTIVMVTHEKEYAALTDRVVVLSDGKVISDTKAKK